jgi:hypothetical protein
MKKNATAAELVFFLPKDRRIEAIIMQMPRPMQPYSMVFLRPIRSSANAGPRLPTININWMLGEVNRTIFNNIKLKRRRMVKLTSLR